jgi:proteasome accessory factor A
MRRFVSEDEIRRAIFQPPETTRAFFRGRAVARFNHEIESIQWDEIVLSSGQLKRTVELAHPAHDASLERLNAAIREAKSFEELARRLG